jgi:hypothetical protein
VIRKNILDWPWSFRIDSELVWVTRLTLSEDGGFEEVENAKFKETWRGSFWGETMKETSMRGFECADDFKIQFKQLIVNILVEFGLSMDETSECLMRLKVDVA